MSQKKTAYPFASLENLRSKKPSDYSANGIRFVRVRLRATIKRAEENGWSEVKEWAEVLLRKYSIPVPTQTVQSKPDSITRDVP